MRVSLDGVVEGKVLVAEGEVLMLPRRVYVGDHKVEGAELAGEARPAPGEDGGGEHEAGGEAIQDEEEDVVGQRAEVVLGAAYALPSTARRERGCVRDGRHRQGRASREVSRAQGGAWAAPQRAEPKPGEVAPWSHRCAPPIHGAPPPRPLVARRCDGPPRCVPSGGRPG